MILWRKQILPLGSIPWRGRELSFTLAYLGDMAAAFTAGALEVVPLMLGDRDTEFTYTGLYSDPSRVGGWVCSLAVVADGMDAVFDVNAETDAMLETAPSRDTAVQIIEGYRTSDGREFPVVLGSVYTTTAPALIGLGPWQRVRG